MWKRFLYLGMSHLAVALVAVALFEWIFPHPPARHQVRLAIAKDYQDSDYNRDDKWIRTARRQLPHRPTILGFSTHQFPLVTGSTSTAPMEPYIVEHLLGLHGDDRLLTRGVKERVFPLTANKSSLTAYSQILQFNTHLGTHQAYTSLVTRSSSDPSTFERDLSLIARKPSAREVAKAKAAGLAFDYRPVARDAFVFLVNRQNSVTALTLEQIRAIYTKRITNWQTLGGKAHEIIAYSRNTDSGSQELMEELVMGDIKMTCKESVLMTMGGPIDAVANDPHALAYSVYFYEEMMNKNPKNTLVGINGIRPTRQSIANRTYPLTADVYVVTRKGMAPDSPTAKMRDWLLSPAGQRVVAESGYIPVLPVTGQ